MVEPEKLLRQIQSLIEKYSVLKMEGGEKGLKEFSEANVRKDFVDPLFAALEWKTDDSHEYDAERYVRGAGFADVALKMGGNPVVFIEAKRFTEVPPRAERNVQTTLSGYKIYADWTSEERQVLNYAAMSINVKWAILTNFEKFRLFNARTGAIILNIEKPEEYFERVDELILLSKRNVESQAIDKLESRVERKDVDLAFLNAMNHWRLRLANQVHKEFPKMPLDELKRVIQRILDRLVIIRYAEDKWVLDDPDQLRAVYEYWQKTRTYTKLSESLRSLFAGFNSVHDSKIFERDEMVEEVLERLNPSLLGDIISELYNQNFRKFTSDILGATYESYLGHELVSKNGSLELQPNEQIRKSGGIYYTPSDVVGFIVDNTVGVELERIWQEVVASFDEGKYEQGTQKFKQISDVKVLDISCGSGSFLIKALELFRRYVEKYDDLVQKTDNALTEKIAETRRKGDNKQAWKLEAERPSKLGHYDAQILRNSIYGVDIDPAAAEIAAVNLVLQALRHNEKLPLILNENIRIGNSLVTGKPEALRKYFSVVQSKRPFDWDAEFQHILSGRKFSCVIGNPPYVNMESMPEEQSYFQTAYPDVYSGKNDLMYYFIYKGITLLRQGGRLGFIVSRYFTDALYASSLRKFILENSAIEAIVDFGNFQVFGRVNVLTLVMILRREESVDVRSNNRIKIARVKKWARSGAELVEHIKEHLAEEDWEDETLEVYRLPQSKLNKDPWSLASPIYSSVIQKMQSKSTPLGQLCDTEQSQKTGLNEVFIVDGKTAANWHLEEQVLRKVITNSEVKKYYIDWTDGYLIYTNDSTRLDEFPNTKKYLLQFKDRLQSRAETKDGLFPWWRLQRPRRESIFSAPEKIIVPFMSTENRFGYDNREDGKGYYGTTDTYMIVPFETCTYDVKFILAVLNSKCLEFYHKNTAKLKRDEYYEYRESLKRLPIPEIDPKSSLYKRIVAQATTLLALKKTYYGSIHTFENLLRNFTDSRTTFESLYDIFKRADVVDLGKSRKLIDNSTVGKISEIKVALTNDSLVLASAYKLVDRTTTSDIIHISVPNRDILNFLYYCTKMFLVKNYRKHEWGRGNIIDTVLNQVKIPKFVANLNMSKDRAVELMNAFYKSAPIGNGNLSNIEIQMNQIQDEIDSAVCECFRLASHEIMVIDQFITENLAEISRTI